jgi:hypothetical protein
LLLLLLLLPPAGAMGSLWLMIPNEYDLKQVCELLRDNAKMSDLQI